MAGLNDDWSQRALNIIERQRGQFIMLLDASLVLVWLGDAADELLGWSDATSLGRSAFDLVHPNDLHVLMRGIDQQRARPAPTDPADVPVEGMQARLLADDGAWVWCELRALTHTPDPDVPAAGFIVRPLSTTTGLEQVANQLGSKVGLDDVLASLGRFLDERFGRGHASMLVGSRWVGDESTHRHLSLVGVHRFLDSSEVRLLTIVDDDQEIVDFVRSAAAASVWIAPVSLPESARVVGAVVCQSEVVDPTFHQFRSALETVARLAGIAIQLHCGKAELIELLTSDPITGAAHSRRLHDLVVKDNMAVIRVNVSPYPAAVVPANSAFAEYFIMEISRRIHSALRPGDLVTRVGTNEFIALLPNILSRGEVERVSGRVKTAVERPLSVAGHLVDTEVFLGVDIRRGTEPIEEMVRRAELALNGKLSSQRS